MGAALLSPAEALTRWQASLLYVGRRGWLNDHDLYLENLPKWAQMYVDGHWTVEKFEAHADAMRDAMFARSPQP